MVPASQGAGVRVPQGCVRNPGGCAASGAGVLGSLTVESSPRPGYYPDPSVPGYMRYWDGSQWVAGTSKPMPEGAGGAASDARSDTRSDTGSGFGTGSGRDSGAGTTRPLSDVSF